MSAEIVIIPVFRDVETRLGKDAGLREQYQRECDALDQAMREPPLRTHLIALKSPANGRAAAMSRNDWLASEIAQLRACYPVMTPAELMAAFPRHPLSSIRSFANDLGIRKIFGTRKWRQIAARHVPTFRLDPPAAATTHDRSPKP